LNCGKIYEKNLLRVDSNNFICNSLYNIELVPPPPPPSLLANLFNFPSEIYRFILSCFHAPCLWHAALLILYPSFGVFYNGKKYFSPQVAFDVCFTVTLNTGNLYVAFNPKNMAALPLCLEIWISSLRRFL
jgi:hypothetical protein